MFKKMISIVAVAGLVFALAPATQAVVIKTVPVGDPGNAADDTGFGAVGYSYYISKYEVTNAQYCEFLNAAAVSDVNGYVGQDQTTQPVMYSLNMGANARGGITRSGSPDNWSYAVRENMGDKPVNFLQGFNVFRYANWLTDPGKTGADTQSGVYGLGGWYWDGKWKGTVTEPADHTSLAPNSFWIPTENEWYKAAFYKGGGTDAGFWDYATQSDAAPTPITADANGNGSAGAAGNFANYDNEADWNGLNGEKTTVGSNGGPSAYGTFDQSGNMGEWLEDEVSYHQARYRGSYWSRDAVVISSAGGAGEGTDWQWYADAGDRNGFRVASNFLVATDVPGDLSGDGDVDLEDVGLFELQFGSQAPGTYTADFDGDEDVDLDDFLVMRNNLGTGVGAAPAAAATPEPASAVLLVLGLGAVIRRRRSRRRSCRRP